MFEYFKNNYAWNLAAVTLIEDVGTISEPAEAFAQVAHLATGDAEEANAAWHDAMVALADRLERMGKEDFGIGRPLSAARKHHRAAMYLLRAERMISHHDERRLVTYRRALENYRAARQLGADGVEFIDIPYKAGSIPAIFVPAEPGKVSPIIVHLQGFDSVKENTISVLAGISPPRPVMPHRRPAGSRGCAAIARPYRRGRDRTLCGRDPRLP